MGRKNIANREDIQPDALRQRRDLYALAIGLLLFNLAGGQIAANTSFGSVLPIALARPWLLLVATWIGFFYFWFRFWLVAEAKPYEDFLEDVRWQVGDSKTVRRIAATFVKSPLASNMTVEQALLSPTGFVPKISLEGRQPILNLGSLTPRGYRNNSQQPFLQVGPVRCEVAEEDARAFWISWAKGFVQAAYRERTFTDYTLPHLFALLTLLVGLGRLATFEAMTFHHQPRTAVKQPASNHGAEAKAKGAAAVDP